MDVAAGRMMSLEIATQPGKDHKMQAKNRYAQSELLKKAQNNNQ